MQNNIALLCYPRSGSSLVLYCIEFLGGTFYTQNKNIFRFHWDYNDISNKYDSLIFLLRDYKECCTRQNCNIKENAYFDTGMKINNTKTNKDTEIDYFGILNFYDKYEKNKLLVYYEDLIDNFEEEIIKVANFLNINNKINILLENKKEYLLKFQKQYDHKTNGLIGKIRDICQPRGYWKQFYTKEELVDWEKFLQINQSKLYTKYLMRYNEKL